MITDYLVRAVAAGQAGGGEPGPPGPHGRVKIAILWTIGIVVLAVGLVLALLGATGRAIGGREHCF